MESRLTNFFTYLKKQDEYSLSFEKLKTILKPYFKHFTNYELYENTYIECLIPAIYYFNDEKLERRINTVLYLVSSENNSNQNQETPKINEDTFLEINSEIIKIRNEYKYLKYFKDSSIELRDQNLFYSDVHEFLMDTGIWIKSPEIDPDGYDYQFEWDIEYFQILNIAYHLNDLEEINDVYNMVWMLWLMQINQNEIR